MLQVRLMGTQEEINEAIKQFEQNYHIEHQSKEYTRSANPKYEHKRYSGIFLCILKIISSLFQRRIVALQTKGFIL
ncbi:DUF3970 family protein [Bacillus megaterium]|nr:DUF3970 family protein [Priestia megaterium]